MPTSRTTVQIVSLLLAATFGVALGACGPHSDYRINKVCKRFCARVYDCNDTVDFDDCVDNCIDDAMDCSSDNDIEASLDILDTCVDESCNQITGCGIDAWLECTF